MEKYNFFEIEKKWQERWEKEQYGESEDFSDKPKHFHLVEFPYPSGAGLHVGHCMGYGASDAYCRMKRMQGYNVMYPIGWDAFGLPTENYALRTGIHPTVATKQNIETFKKQIKKLGYAFDWSREVNTTDPDYYKWTQWIFLQFYKHAIVDGKLIEVADDDVITPRLAYQKKMPINWCPSCKIGLANEEVINGKCERCGTQTEKRQQTQWILRITAYADRLIDDLATVDYLEKIKTQQINWIGRSEGAELEFRIKNLEPKIKIFTTRPDTLFGATYMVIAPEHPLVDEIKDDITNYDEVIQYVQESKKKSDLERTELQKEKTGVELKGIRAINPVSQEEIPVFVADYVLISYGTGAIMAVPAHDERDWEFAKKYNLPIKEVVRPREGTPREGSEFRRTVSAVIRRPKDNKYLLLKWKKFGWVSFPLGGIENDEPGEKAIVREVLEETGYHVKPIEKLGGETESHFFADNKNVWRERLDQSYLCELIDENPVEVSKEEKEKHEVVWMTAEEAFSKVTHRYNLIGLERYVSHNYSFAREGIAINSDFLNGLTTKEAKQSMIDWLEKNGIGKRTKNYKLRDWIFSRQHYWGEPIPIIHCEKCGTVPIGESELPLCLPEVERYEPTDTGESPLARIHEWVNVVCPKCGEPAKRETDTMPNWAGSSWYFLRYCDPNNGKQLADDKKLEYWMPVDLYNGGMEHTTLHLLYSRFWNKFLFDLGAVPTSEPYAKRIAHGIILGPDGQKMSKSRGNVINPDEMIERYGADSLRAYIMFIGPYDQESAWSTAGIQGVHRFLNRLWKNYPQKFVQDEKELLVKLNQTINGLTDDLENFRLNTVISKLMEFNNTLEKVGGISKESYHIYLKLLFPAAPHLASELWERTGGEGRLEYSEWPKADEKYLIADTIEIVIQVNGKVRDRLQVPSSISNDEMEKVAFSSEKIKQFTDNKEIIKVITVPKKLVNIVVQS